jgi:membrane fusion protein (multidrug efflux system)
MMSPPISASHSFRHRAAPHLGLLGLAMFLAGCEEQKQVAAPPPPPDVEIVAVEQKDVPIYREWVATTTGFLNADIKGQVSGYLIKQAYKDGAYVKKDELMFEIDPRPLQAALMQAKGQLEQAKGQLALAKSQVDQQKAQLSKSQAEAERTLIEVNRLTPLAKDGAVSQQELDNAVQNNAANNALVDAGKATIRAAESNVEANQANVAAAQAFADQATLNLAFTKITAPIEGLAGIAKAQIGDLVGPQTGIVLTTVSTIDPIKVVVQISEQQYMRSVDKMLELMKHESPEILELIMADGSVFPHKGRISVADRQVDPRTGTITIQGLFPNPGGILRPGQFARVKAQVDTKKGALLLPQRCVTELQGAYQVAVVDSSGKVSIKNVKVGDRIGSTWIIEEGLSHGEHVVSEGVQKARPGSTVNPKLVPAEGESKSGAEKGAAPSSAAPKEEHKPSAAPAEPKKHEAK